MVEPFTPSSSKYVVFCSETFKTTIQDPALAIAPLIRTKDDAVRVLRTVINLFRTVDNFYMSYHTENWDSLSEYVGLWSQASSGQLPFFDVPLADLNAAAANLRMKDQVDQATLIEARMLLNALRCAMVFMMANR